MLLPDQGRPPTPLPVVYRYVTTEFRVPRGLLRRKRVNGRRERHTHRIRKIRYSSRPFISRRLGRGLSDLLRVSIRWNPDAEEQEYVRVYLYLGTRAAALAAFLARCEIAQCDPLACRACTLVCAFSYAFSYLLSRVGDSTKPEHPRTHETTVAPISYVAWERVVIDDVAPRVRDV